jgi:hypothetical protein
MIDIFFVTFVSIVVLQFFFFFENNSHILCDRLLSCIQESVHF